MYEYYSTKSKTIPYKKPHPDSPYEQVRLYKSRDKFNKDKIEDAYLDRMSGWEPEKYKEASEAIGKHNLYRVAGMPIEDVEKFLTVYNGYPCKLIEASENLGYNGYHYTYLMWEKLE